MSRTSITYIKLLVFLLISTVLVMCKKPNNQGYSKELKMELSTQNLALLSKPIDLKKMCKSISTLEAIICQEWQYRYYSYQKNWDINEEVFEMRNGQGDHMLILFNDYGAVINGFAHLSKMNGWKSIEIKKKRKLKEKLFNINTEPKIELKQTIWNGVVDSLPTEFNEFVFGEPIKTIGTTFCIWSTTNEWQIGDIDFPNDQYKDGSLDLLKLLNGNPETYFNWASEYYELAHLKLKDIQSIYSSNSLTKDIAHSLNPNIDFEQLESDLLEIGYPFELN